MMAGDSFNLTYSTEYPPSYMQIPYLPVDRRRFEEVVVGCMLGKVGPRMT